MYTDISNSNFRLQNVYLICLILCLYLFRLGLEVERHSPWPGELCWPWACYAMPCWVSSVMFNSVWLYGLYVACQASLSMEFSRQEYWSGFPCPPPGDLPNSGIKHVSLKSSVLDGVTALVSFLHPSSALPCIPGGWHPKVSISLAPQSAGFQVIFVSGEHC